MVDAGFLCDKAPVTAAMPRDMIRSTLYITPFCVLFWCVV